MKNLHKNILILLATLLLLAISSYLFYQTMSQQDILTSPQKSKSAAHYQKNTILSEINDIQVTGLHAPTAYHDGNKIVYGTKSWQYIGPRFVKIKGVERECIWVHPEEKPISFTWKLHHSRSVKISFLSLDSIDKTTSLKIDYKLTGSGEDEGFSLRILPENEKITNTFTKGPYETITVTLTASKTAKNHWCMQGRRW
ncbi:hypothetical protein KAH37_03325 [bacterium]|nr:hypothetical protein [bacterium]